MGIISGQGNAWLEGNHESDGGDCRLPCFTSVPVPAVFISVNTPIADIVTLIPTLSTLIQPYIPSDVTLYTTLYRSMRSTNHLRSHLLLP